jgi:hypothetical protein
MFDFVTSIDLPVTAEINVRKSSTETRDLTSDWAGNVAGAPHAEVHMTFSVLPNALLNTLVLQSVSNVVFIFNQMSHLLWLLSGQAWNRFLTLSR